MLANASAYSAAGRLLGLLVLAAASIATRPGTARAGLGNALRMINLDAPETALQGDTIHLSCFFSLQRGPSVVQHLAPNGKSSLQAAGQVWPEESEPFGGREKFKSTSHVGELQSGPASGSFLGKQAYDEAQGDEQLYAIKWYKNEREFFRFVAQDWPKKQALPMEGLQVDLNKSDNRTVVLRNVSLKTSGIFKCEVSTDAPYFLTKSIERKLLIYYLPNEGPRIERTYSNGHEKQHIRGGQRTAARHQLVEGEPLELLCSTPESKPPAALDWIINESLNLTAYLEERAVEATASGRVATNQAPTFQVKSQRFVRLQPSAALASGMANVSSNPVGGAARGSQSSNSSPLKSSQVVAGNKQAPNSASRSIIYELQNETMAIPTSGSTLPVNVAGLLDQLVEMSASRLNLTVDANLLRLLGHSGQEGGLTRVNERHLTELDTIDRGGQFAGAGSNGRQSVLLDSYSSRQKPLPAPLLAPNSKANNFLTNAPTVRPPSFELSFVTTRHIKPANNRKAILKGARSDSPNFTLRIRCVARVWHLNMSDEIRMGLVNKIREMADPAPIDAQRRTRPEEKANSDSHTSGLGFGGGFGCGFLISIVTLNVMNILYRFL